MVRKTFVRALAVGTFPLGTQAPDRFVFDVDLRQPVDVVWHAKVVIKSKRARSRFQRLGGQIFDDGEIRVTQMPLTDLGSLIPMFFQILGSVNSSGSINNGPSGGLSTPYFNRPLQAYRPVSKSVSSRSADGTGCIGVEKLDSFLCKSIDIWSSDVPDVRTVAVGTAVTEVIGQNDDDIRGFPEADRAD